MTGFTLHLWYNQIHVSLLATICDPRAVTFKRPVKPENGTWMDDAMLKNIEICFPEVFTVTFSGLVDWSH